MTAPGGYTPMVRVLADGVQLPDGCMQVPEDSPTVLSGLSVAWGRDSTIDQPSPASCSFEVWDPQGGTTFQNLLRFGAKLDVVADAQLYAPSGTIETFPALLQSYVSMQNGTRATAGAALRFAPTDPTRQFSAAFSPGAASNDPTAWDAIPRTAQGQNWLAAVTVLPVWSSVAGWTRPAHRIRPMLYTGPQDGNPTALPDLPPGGGTFTPPAGYWVGLQVLWYPTGPRWDEVGATYVWAPATALTTNVIPNPRAVQSGAAIWAPSLSATGGVKADTWETASSGAVSNIVTARRMTFTTPPSAWAYLGWTMTPTVRYPVSPGQTWTSSVYIRTNSATPKSARIQYQWSDAAGVAIGSLSYSLAMPLRANTWNRVSFSATAPAGAATLRYTAYVWYFAGDGQWLAGEWVEGTAAQLELAPAATATGNPLTDGPKNLLHGFWAEDPLWAKPADGALVSSWRNAGGGAATEATPARQPTYRKGSATNTSMNGRDYIQHLSSQYLMQNVTDQAQPFWVVVICKLDDNSAGQRAPVGFGDGTYSAVMKASGTVNRWLVGAKGDGSLVVVDPSQYTNLLPHLLAAKLSGTSSSLWLDELGTNGSAGTPGLTHLSIGGSNTAGVPSSYFVGAIHFVGVYSSDPRADPKWSVITKLAQSAGVPSAYVDGSLLDTATVDYAWTGAANASTSTATPLTLGPVVPDTMTWRQLDQEDISAISLKAPAAGTVRSALVFSGRVTDLEARYEDGATMVKVIAQDQTADLANRGVGDEPWDVERLDARAKRILDLAGYTGKLAVTPLEAGAQISYRDVDHQGAMALLGNLGASADGYCWIATHVTTGPVFRLDSMQDRPSLQKLQKNGTIHIITSPDFGGKGGVSISACSVELEPVRWEQSGQDVATRVDVVWKEQLIEDGLPKPQDHTYSQVDSTLELSIGAHRVSMTTERIDATQAGRIAGQILSRLSRFTWVVRGLTWTQADEALSATMLDTFMQLLDGYYRFGLPVMLTDLPTWTPVPPGTAKVPLFLEGGRYTFEDGSWVLELWTSSAAASGGAGMVLWNQIPADWLWNQWDPTVRWLDLAGVGI